MPGADDDLPARRGPRVLLFAIPVALCVAAGAYVATQLGARRSLDKAPGTPQGALVVAGGAGSGTATALVLVDRVGRGATKFRLVALDLDTGARLGSRVVEESARCWPASIGRMWCADADGRTHLVAVPSFEAVAAGSDSSAASRASPDNAKLGCELLDSLPLGDDHLTFGRGMQRRPLVRHAPHEEGKEPQTGSLPGIAEFLAPSFLSVGDPSIVLVLHDAALDRPGVQQISRVDDQLHLMWTADMPARCESAHLVGGKLVLTTTDAAHRALAIDVTSGKLAWQYAGGGG